MPATFSTSEEFYTLVVGLNTLKDGETTLALKFERFASLTSLHQIWQRVTVNCQGGNPQLALQTMLDGDVKNLNLVSSEPLPVQPGRNHISKLGITGNNQMEVTLDGEDATQLNLCQKVSIRLNGKKQRTAPVKNSFTAGEEIEVNLCPGDTLVLEKAVHIYADFEAGTEQAGRRIFAEEPVEYAGALEKQQEAWVRRWATADFIIDGPERDQGALRYNLFELLAACPLHSDTVIIKWQLLLTQQLQTET